MLRTHRVSLFCNKIIKLDTIQFKIYDASAGSGKTYTLVKEYLSVLLSSESPVQVKQILAITFTNKAVKEMKSRVLKYLEAFASETVLFTTDQMAFDICQKLQIDLRILHQRAEKVLKFILHNYFYFDIVTIDKFNYNLLKTFAHDLKLPVNFEAGIDTKLLLEEAVDNLIDTAGNDELLTGVLIDFALSKADTDKSWDISRDLKKTASLLLEENHKEHIDKIKSKSLHDFNELNVLLKRFIEQQANDIISEANNMLYLFETNNLEFSDFKGKYLPNFIQKIAEGNFECNFETKWQQEIDDKPLYSPSKVKEEKASILDNLQQRIVTKFLEIKNKIFQLQFLRNFQNNLVPLSLLNSVNRELQKIKEDRNLLLVSEFNSIISETISNQPAPFIYERIGEKYRHYFIDEFQDTSEMQWSNLLPLIDNALQAETLDGKKGTLMIVGDAKQAIYRWRGGKAEQFIGLCNDINPFYTPKKVERLPVNYRSYDEIIKFNNRFFEHTAQYLSNINYRDLYQNHSKQESNNKKGGYINFNFVENDEDEVYCELVLNHIHSLTNSGYSYKGICILTQKKKHGFILANFLAENNVPVISSESLLLKNNVKVDFLIQLIRYSIYPDNKEIILTLIQFFAERDQVQDKHSYILKYINSINDLFGKFSFSMNDFASLPFYNAIEYAIIAFQLNRDSDAYLQYFLDEILNMVNSKQGPHEFLNYWENKKESLSIVAPQESDAINIMTIHKSKGLEFPVIIFPFANTDIYSEIDPKAWLPVNEETFGITNVLINKKKEMTHYNDYAAAYYEESQEKLELDQFNVLYVAFTRAVEKLYIISKKNTDAGGNEKLNTFSGLFINFLKSEEKYNDTQNVYEYGAIEKATINLPDIKSQKIPYIASDTFNKSFKIITKSGSLWDTNQERAIEKGNLYHYILSKIKYQSDMIDVIDEAQNEGLIPIEEREMVIKKLNEVIFHPALEEFFNNLNIVHNEQNILNKDGFVSKPDRIVVTPQSEVTLIDYKTGNYYEKHTVQLQTYASSLREMGYNVRNIILVFINEKIDIRYI